MVSKSLKEVGKRGARIGEESGQAIRRRGGQEGKLPGGEAFGRRPRFSLSQSTGSEAERNKRNRLDFSPDGLFSSTHKTLVFSFQNYIYTHTEYRRQ